MGEFDLIRLIHELGPDERRDVAVGIGDDGAVLTLPPGQEIVASTDSLNQGVHFLAGCDPEALGHKALAVNLSDLAAMGAEPAWVLLNLSLPEVDRDWLRAFMRGFTQLARSFHVSLVGGDLCRGPLGLAVTALGFQPVGQRLLRSGARPGDQVVVSGELGGAARALQMRRADQVPPRALSERLDRPEPRVGLGRALRGVATACIDLSDGLASDLGHIAGASGCRIDIQLDHLPYSPLLDELGEEQRHRLLLGGGDDYELCFTLPVDGGAVLEQWREELGVELTEIGCVRAGKGVAFRRPDGTGSGQEWYGYNHFD